MKETGLTLILGPMFSGKTTELIRRARRFRIAGMEYQIFRWDKDNRYGEEIANHDGTTIGSQAVKDTLDIEARLMSKPECRIIGIDEIQFFDERIIEFCIKNLQKFYIIATGLNLDFKCEPFKFRESQKHIGELMPHAREIIFETAICDEKVGGVVCGKEARFTQRMIDGEPCRDSNSPLILVGNQNFYVARCEEHYVIPGKIKQPNNF